MPVRGGPMTNSGAVDRLGRDRRRRAPRGLERSHVCSMRSTSPRVITRADQVQLRLAVDRVERAAVGLLPSRPFGFTEVVEPGRRARDREHLVGVEAHHAGGITRRLAEQVHPADPLGMLHDRRKRGAARPATRGRSRKVRMPGGAAHTTGTEFTQCIAVATMPRLRRSPSSTESGCRWWNVTSTGGSP